MTDVVAFVDEGLGHSSYLIDLGDHRALVVDPPRLPDAQRARAARERVELAFTADTHTHADYVSGSPELAATGATFLAPAAARLETAHQPLDGGAEVELARCVLRALATPGHTPDHLAYLLLDGDGRPVALFSGGSLMVGTVGRTDLAGAERTEELARAQYHSLHEQILTLPDDLVVYPTHGQGSFCSAPGATQRTTTIGRERASNSLLQLDEDRFVEQLIASFGTLPAYFRRLPTVNRLGPRLYGRVPELRELSVGETQQRVAEGALVVDARSVDAFSRAHIPGSVSNALRPGFATWLASTLPAEAPLIFVVDDDQDVVELVREALNVGHERLVGVLGGGIDGWRDSGMPTAMIELVRADQVDGPVLDVRQQSEFGDGHLPEARNIELGSIAEVRVSGPVTLMCGHGERAMTAASLLTRGGADDVRVLDGGPADWSHATGRRLEDGA